MKWCTSCFDELFCVYLRQDLTNAVARSYLASISLLVTVLATTVLPVILFRRVTWNHKPASSSGGATKVVPTAVPSEVSSQLRPRGQCKLNRVWLVIVLVATSSLVRFCCVVCLVVFVWWIPVCCCSHSAVLGCSDELLIVSVLLCCGEQAVLQLDAHFQSQAPVTIPPPVLQPGHFFKVG